MNLQSVGTPLALHLPGWDFVFPWRTGTVHSLPRPQVPNEGIILVHQSPHTPQSPHTNTWLSRFTLAMEDTVGSSLETHWITGR